MHRLLIYNPVSGRANFRTEHLGKIIYELTGMGHELTVYQTQGKGDGKRYLSQISPKQYDMIVCCGGDGTLHELVNGLMENQLEIPLGYIPSGSTNDYAKNLGISSRNALKCIQQANIHNIDIGNFNGEFFNYVAAFGAFTNISFLTPQKVKNTLGYLAYLLEGVKHLSDIKPYHITCRLADKVIEDDMVIGMITNAFSVAGVKNKNDGKTRLDDGMMEYVFIKMPKNLLDLQTIITSLLNSKIDEKFMYYGRSPIFEIQSDKMEWTLDGESGGMLESVEIKTYQHALKMVVKEGKMV